MWSTLYVAGLGVGDQLLHSQVLRPPNPEVLQSGRVFWVFHKPLSAFQKENLRTRFCLAKTNLGVQKTKPVKQLEMMPESSQKSDPRVCLCQINAAIDEQTSPAARKDKGSDLFLAGRKNTLSGVTPKSKAPSHGLPLAISDEHQQAGRAQDV